MSITFLLTALAVLSAAWLNATPIVRTLADFATPSEWRLPTTPGMTAQFRSDGLLQVDWKAASQPTVWEIRLNKPRPLDPAAQRVFVKLFVKIPMDQNKLFVLLADRNGTEFTYTLPQLEKWATNWRIVDTFPFDANESGRMHPLVGRANRPGSPLPVPPLQLLGLKVEAAANTSGCWLFDQVGSDAYTLGSATHHWGLNLPGEHYWMTTTLIRSEATPYVPLDWLNPTDQGVKLHWELVAGPQGPGLKSGEERLSFPAGNYRARERRLELGPLPPGLYTVNCSITPEDLSKAGPDGWQPIVWNAEGQAVWGRDSGLNRSRSFLCHKRAGSGYVSWRLTQRLAAPGRAVFQVSAKGDGNPTAWMVPLDRSRRSLGPARELKFNNPAAWERKEATVTLPAETDQVYVYLAAMKPGSAEFDGVALIIDGKNVLRNSDAEQGQVLRQVILPLNVIASTSTAPAPRPFVSSVKPGETLTIPLPDWSRRTGQASWCIIDPAGRELVGDKIVGPELRWQAPARPGIYRFIAQLKDGTLELDRKELTLGVKGVLPAKVGVRRVTGPIPTENDLFGSGKNYFTWSMYENHPDQPGYLEELKKWIVDGRKAGFDLFRIRLDWNWIEPAPGVYDFTLTDRVIDEVLKQGGKVILELRNEAPGWLDYESQLDGYGRADIWRHGKIGRIPSLWSPGMLKRIRDFTVTAASRYADNPGLAGYHVWGLPGSLDWTNLDRPWLGIQTDFSAAALKKFHEREGRDVPGTPQSSRDFSAPDLSRDWRCWVEFRRNGLEEYMIENVIKPLRGIDPKRSIIGYFGLDFASPRLAASARELGWRRHTGGCALYYQTQLGAMRALSDIGRPFPQEVHLMTPVPAELEQATSQLTVAGGQGLHWNYYWRSNIRTGAWTPERNAGLNEWQQRWRPLWQELRDARPTEPPAVMVLSSWSTMQYLVRSFFTMRQDDMVTRLAAALYRDGVWPDWCSENAPDNVLDGKKLLIVPASGGQVLTRAMADTIRVFVENGGQVLLFPDSGRWVVEEPGNDFALLKRLGWSGPLPEIKNRVETEDGNSGFSRQTPVSTELTFRPGSPLATLGKLRVNNPANVARPDGKVSVEGHFSDGSPAVLRWPCGRGEVLFVAGHPDWEKVPGFLGLVAKRTGAVRQAGGNQPWLLVNALVKGKDRYLIVTGCPTAFGLIRRRWTGRCWRVSPRSMPPGASAD